MKSFQILMECFSLDLFSPSTKRSDSCIGLFVSMTFLLKGGECGQSWSRFQLYKNTGFVKSFINHRGIGFVAVSSVRGLPCCYSKSKDENVFMALEVWGFRFFQVSCLFHKCILQLQGQFKQFCW